MAKRVKYSARPTRGRPSRPAAKPSSAASVPDDAPETTRPARTATTRPAAPVPTADDAEPSDRELFEAPSRGHLSDAELKRAEALEDELVASERRAATRGGNGTARAAAAADRRADHPADVNAPLKVRAAHEYAYVARDVRRIALTASLMVVILAILFVLINVLGVIST